MLRTGSVVALVLSVLNPLLNIIDAISFFNNDHVMWSLALLLPIFAPFLANFVIFLVKKFKSWVGTENPDCKFMPLLQYLPFFDMFR
jgi:hypothetical protein